MTQHFAQLISLAIEVPTVLLLAQLTERTTYRNLLLLLILACCATLITHPLAWASNQKLFPYLTFPLRAFLIESAVVIVEGALYVLAGEMSWRRGLFLSTIANATSFFLGLLIYYLL